jgi:crotonobetainyl-CoA:carnitine CoA-transferase CaiB-like acyl-CoA transferase
VRHNQSFIKSPGISGSPITLVYHPVRSDGKAPEMRLAPQPLGGQTQEVFSDLGCNDVELNALEAGGMIRRAPVNVDPALISA